MGSITVETRSTSCYLCGAPIVMSADQYRQRLDDGRDFYCPNGHGQHFTESRQTELDRCKRRSDYWHERMVHWMGRCEDLERTVQAYRMNAGKQRKRIRELEAELAPLREGTADAVG